MLHPSYTELIAKVNEGVEPGDEPIVQSRYSIVCATAKRARQLIDEMNNSQEAVSGVAKPLSDAVRELDNGELVIMTNEEYAEKKAEMEATIADRVAIKLAARREAEENAAKLAALEKAEAEEDDNDDEEFDDDSEIIDDLDEE